VSSNPGCDEFASFGYQTQSWKKPGRVVAKRSGIRASRTRASASSSPTWDVGPNESSPSTTSVRLTGAMSRVRWPRSRCRDRCSPTSRHRSPACGHRPPGMGLVRAQILRATRGEVSLAGKASSVQHSGAANRPLRANNRRDLRLRRPLSGAILASRLAEIWRKSAQSHFKRQ
jgi:hypothetical protein